MILRRKSMWTMLLSLTSLETLGLKVNPVERTLESSEFTLYASSH